MEVAFRETVSEAKARGQTVFLSSHILSEVEALCDRVGILRDGEARRRGHARASCATSARRRSRSPSTARTPKLAELPGVRVSSAGPNALRFEVSGSVAPLIAALAEHRCRAEQPRALARGDLPAPLRRAPTAMSSALDAIARRALADSRVRTTCLRLPVRARRLRQRGRLPPRLSDARRAASRSPTASPATTRVRLFYGEPYDLLIGRRLHRLARRRAARRSSPRVLGLLAAVRALRAEEDAGRAGARARRRRRAPRQPYLAVLAAIAAGMAIAVARRVRGPGRGGPPAGRLGVSALAIVVRRAGVRRRGRAREPARADAPGRARARQRRASAYRSSLRVRRRHLVGASAGCAGRRRWAGPRNCGPFTGARPAGPAAAARGGALLLAVAGAIALAPRHRHRPAPGSRQCRRRDCAAALLADRAGAAQRARQPRRVAARQRRCFAFIVGVVSTSISSAGISGGLQRELAQARGGVDRPRPPATSASCSCSSCSP